MSEKTEKDWKKFKEEIIEQDELVEDATFDDTEELDTNSSALEHLSYQELEDKLTLSEQKTHDNWEKSVRAMAELDNVVDQSVRLQMLIVMAWKNA